MDADSEGIGHGIADRGAWRNDRRLAEADHTATPLALGIVEFDNELADIAEPAELVVCQIGVYKRASRRIVDPLLEQGIRDAHDERAVDLALCLLWADHQADVLHGDELFHPHDAGLFIDLNVGHLHATYLLVRQRAARAAGIVGVGFQRRHAEQRASFLPADAFAWIAGDLNTAIDRLKLAGFHVELFGN